MAILLGSIHWTYCKKKKDASDMVAESAREKVKKKLKSKPR